MKFLGFDIGSYKKPVIIAEISCNHEQNQDSAFAHMHAAKLAGVDILKIQAYTPDEMVADKNYIIKNSRWAGKNLHEFYEKTATPLEWLPGLFNYAREINIPLFSSVFGKVSLEALEKCNCPAYKIASFEIGDLELIKEIKSYGKPTLASTGCANEADLENCYKYISIFMHCVSKYPTEFRVSELRRIADLQFKYFNPIGYSDHTRSSVSAQMAYALGTNLFEKHFSLSPTSEDAAFSLNRYEFEGYVRDLNAAADAMSFQNYHVNEFKRSLYVVGDIQQGQLIDDRFVQPRRPNAGIATSKLKNVIGKRAKDFIPAGTPLTEDLYE